ncbi:Predicted secreted protein [Rhizobium sp. NFR07]|uniref:phage tail tube protein n=1 Tax=Rhizobium sp. NFR07 TaxID=1566262 RepID=UPI0008EC742D|nr:phage tail tube protein [Rhizobium sp. NFR07]SFB52274.1 Predicted secreted protein [Rhizobium sp. NFR07]
MALGEQLGRLLLIKLGNGLDPEVFSNLCGLKDRSFDLSANSVDTTKPSCTNPGEAVQKTGRPGIVSRTFQGSGTFVSSVAMKAFMVHVIEATVFNAQVIVPGLGTFEGSFFVTNFQATGDMENDLQFSATFEAAAPLEFTAEA